MLLEKKLEELRELWKQNPSKRSVIERQARAIQIAIDKRDKTNEKNVAELILK